MGRKFLFYASFTRQPRYGGTHTQDTPEDDMELDTRLLVNMYIPLIHYRAASILQAFANLERANAMTGQELRVQYPGFTIISVMRLHIEEFLTHAGVLASILYNTKNPDRSEALRTALGLQDTSALSNRRPRNMLQHEDEYLDDDFSQVAAGAAGILSLSAGIVPGDSFAFQYGGAAFTQDESRQILALARMIRLHLEAHNPSLWPDFSKGPDA